MFEMKEFPIKYIEDNLVMNQGGDCFAYYELIPYNYSFLSPQQKEQIRQEFCQLVSGQRGGVLHGLMISTESDIRLRQEKSKKLVKGRLKETAYEIIDLQTEILEKRNKEAKGNGGQIDYRFFLGFKLIGGQTEVSIKKMKDDVKMIASNFVREVNHRLAGDFYSISNTEMARYSRLEKALRTKISRRFKFRRLDEKDFGYLIEHLYGQTIVPYYDYDYKLPKEKFLGDTLVKRYDLLKLTRCLMEEHQRYIKLTREKEESYVACLTIDTLVGELEFPSSELFYYQQAQFEFPVDVSMHVEIIDNKKALGLVRNKKKELEDQNDHAWQNDTDTEDAVLNGIKDSEELENELSATKGAMYKLSYVIRVTASSLEDLEEHVDAIKDFYSDSNIRLVRPFGDMLGLSWEFLPASERYLNDYVQYVTADFLGGLGFGASQMLGDECGIYVGYNRETGKHVYINPALAAQGIKGTVTNALATAVLGSLGGGKSMFSNLKLYYTSLYGGKVLVIDPKSERGHWKEGLPEFGDEMNIVNLTSEEKNRGMLDPFVIMKRVKDAESLAMDVLTYLTGVTINDGDKFPEIREAVRRVAKRKRKGLRFVIEELHNAGNPIAENLARHIEGFCDYDFAQLLFSEGDVKGSISLDKQLNIIQVQDLVLPGKETPPSEYSSTERLSVAMLIAISSFALDFIYSDRKVFKEIDLDEAWSILGVAQGKALAGKMIRAGRSMNAGVDVITQNSEDVGDEKMKNNIGAKFAFRSKDIVEIKKTLTFFGLDPEDEGNQGTLSGLENGECLYQDIYGRTGVLCVDVMFKDLFDVFDTRPPQEIEEGGMPDEETEA